LIKAGGVDKKKKKVKTMERSKLNERQKLFCREYVIDFNGTRAAKAAGYSEKTADRIASENLIKLDIQDEIKRLTKDKVERTEITADRVVRELAKIAFGTIDDLGKFTEEGEFILHNSNDMNESGKASLNTVSSSTTTGDGGKSTTLKITRQDKIKALELLGRHVGAFNNDESGKSTIKVTIGKPKQ
jgi:phage terminase small subunit